MKSNGSFFKKIKDLFKKNEDDGEVIAASEHEEQNDSKGVIKSFEIVTLRKSGMRGSTEEEILMKDGEAEISLYFIRYSDGKSERVLEKRVVCDAGMITDLLNDCKMLSWDGFDGPHPKGVRDGIMFSLNAVVNGDQKIYAHGSQNFPRHYREFTDKLYGLLNGSEKSG